MGYLETARDFYRDAALTPDEGLCCTSSPTWVLPELQVPEKMLQMNYGCGSTVHPRDLAGSPDVLYVGVGGGLELLQFAYFTRRPGSVVGIDPVPEMRRAAADNLAEAEAVNPWFRAGFVRLEAGDALELPVPDASVDVVAQNCVFNMLEADDLRRALAEIDRVLRPRGRFVTSDPVAPGPLPARLVADERLRAMCLSGAVTYERYVQALVEAGFGTVEVRARRPYRVLSPPEFDVPGAVLLESVEIAAIKDPVPEDGACVFTGRNAIYHGPEPVFDDRKGHVLPRNQPAAVCDKTAQQLLALGRSDLVVTPSTWFYDGGGCC